MKKRLLNIVMHERFCQVLFLISAATQFLPKNVTRFHMFFAGFNIAACLYWEFYIHANRRAKFWRDRAFESLDQSFERGIKNAFREMGHAIELRKESRHIDVDKN